MSRCARITGRADSLPGAAISGDWRMESKSSKLRFSKGERISYPVKVEETDYQVLKEEPEKVTPEKHG